MPATDADRIKRALRIPAGITIHDVRLGEIAGEVDSDLLERFHLSSWDSATRYSESLDVLGGTSGTVILLHRHPITSIVALTASGVRLVQDTDYRVDRGGVVRLLGSMTTFDYGRGTVLVDYTAGHVVAGSTPSWLARLATLQGALQYNAEPQVGIGDLTVDPVQKSLSDPEIDGMQREIRRILARWGHAGE